MGIALQKVQIQVYWLHNSEFIINHSLIVPRRSTSADLQPSLMIMPLHGQPYTRFMLHRPRVSMSIAKLIYPWGYAKIPMDNILAPTVL